MAMIRVLRPFSCTTGTEPEQEPHSRFVGVTLVGAAVLPDHLSAANKTTVNLFGFYSVGEIQYTLTVVLFCRWQL